MATSRGVDEARRDIASATDRISVTLTELQPRHLSNVRWPGRNGGVN